MSFNYRFIVLAMMNFKYEGLTLYNMKTVV